MKIWLVEISGTAVRAFADKLQADLYMVSLLHEEFCEGEPMYFQHELEVVPIEFEK
jgi:hypothetical protein